MSVASNFNNDLNNYFTKINLEKINTNNLLTKGISTNSAKKAAAALHRRNNSNSFFGSENGQTTNLLEKNFSKLNLRKEEAENKNLNLNLNNNNNLSLTGNGAGSHPLDSYILKHKGPVLTINRKKSSVSPLQKIPKNSKYNISNSNNNFIHNNFVNSGSNAIFGSAESGKNQAEDKSGNNNYNAENRNVNEFGTIDIKFEIKNKHFQLPNLYPENKFKKINNYSNAVNSKRNNNSITPNKFIYNSQNIGQFLAKKQENVNGDENTKGIRRFNYPTATQILHNRVNK